MYTFGKHMHMRYARACHSNTLTSKLSIVLHTHSGPHNTYTQAQAQRERMHKIASRGQLVSKYYT